MSMSSLLHSLAITVFVFGWSFAAYCILVQPLKEQIRELKKQLEWERGEQVSQKWFPSR